MCGLPAPVTVTSRDPRISFSSSADSCTRPTNEVTCTDPCYQHGMITALADEDSPAHLTSVYRSRAEYTTEPLQGTGCEPIAAEGGFYAILRCEAWNADHGFASSKELARDILQRVHVAVVPGTDFGVPHDLRLAFCNDRYNDGIDRLREYFTTSNPDGRLMSAAGAEA